MRIVALSGALAIAVLVPAFASCASTDDDPVVENEGSTLPPTSDAATDAETDAGLSCDASDPDCVTHAVTCDEATWCPVATGVSDLYALVSVWGTAPNDVWAAGSGGNVVHYDGATWSAKSTGVHNTFHAIAGSSATDVWAVSASDVLLHTTNRGATWTTSIAAADPYSVSPLYAAWSDQSGNLRVGGQVFSLQTPDGFGQGNQYVKTTLGDAGIGWTGQPGQATVHGIWGASADDLWIIGDNSQNASWQLGLVQHGQRGDGGIAWQDVDSQSAVSLRAIWGSSATDVWTVGDLGTIRHLGPDRFEPVSSSTTEHLHGLWGSAANDLWAVGESGTILHFDGAAWSASAAAFPAGKTKPTLYGVWGSGANDVWIVGDGIALHKGGSK